MAVCTAAGVGGVAGAFAGAITYGGIRGIQVAAPYVAQSALSVVRGLASEFLSGELYTGVFGQFGRYLSSGMMSWTDSQMQFAFMEEEAAGRVPYNGTDLSQAVVAAREARGLQFSWKNGAAVEYLENGEPSVQVAFSERGVGHSETLLNEWLQENEISPDQVTRWYSERQPCNCEPYYCDQLLSTVYPSAKVTWSIPFRTAQEIASAKSVLLGELARVFGR